MLPRPVPPCRPAASAAATGEHFAARPAAPFSFQSTNPRPASDGTERWATAPEVEAATAGRCGATDRTAPPGLRLSHTLSHIFFAIPRNSAGRPRLTPGLARAGRPAREKPLGDGDQVLRKEESRDRGRTAADTRGMRRTSICENLLAR